MTRLSRNLLVLILAGAMVITPVQTVQAASPTEGAYTEETANNGERTVEWKLWKEGKKQYYRVISTESRTDDVGVTWYSRKSETYRYWGKIVAKDDRPLEAKCKKSLVSSRANMWRVKS